MRLFAFLVFYKINLSKSDRLDSENSNADYILIGSKYLISLKK